jgi:hypothetical protein
MVPVKAVAAAVEEEVATVSVVVAVVVLAMEVAAVVVVVVVVVAVVVALASARMSTWSLSRVLLSSGVSRDPTPWRRRLRGGGCLSRSVLGSCPARAQQQSPSTRRARKPMSWATHLAHSNSGPPFT